jgi:hypothetical protein
MAEEEKPEVFVDPYPTCTKLAERGIMVRVIMDFLTWLIEEGKVDVIDSFMSVNNRTDVNNHQKLLFLYLGIDPTKLEVERRAMLEEQRKRNETKETTP